MNVSRSPHQSTRQPSSRSRSKTAVASLALVALSVIGFAGPASAAPGQDSDGTPAEIITLSTNPESGLSVDEMAPGDVTEWATSVQNVSGRTVPVTAEFGHDDEVAQSPLTLDTTFGMQVTLDTCSQPWTAGVAGPENATVFTCGGAEGVMLASTPLGSLVGAPYQSDVTLDSRETLNIRATMKFPWEAGNDFENLKGGVRVEFTSFYDDPTPPSSIVPSPPGENPPTSPPTSGPTVPVTGSDVIAIVAIGAALALVGAAIWKSTRQRKTDSTTGNTTTGNTEPDGQFGDPVTEFGTGPITEPAADAGDEPAQDHAPPIADDLLDGDPTPDDFPEDFTSEDFTSEDFTAEDPGVGED